MMKKLFFLSLIAGFVFTSCTNDDVPVLDGVTVRVDPSTILEPFSYQINAGDLDGVGETQSLRIRLLVYDEDGNLYASEEQNVPNYLASANFNVAVPDDAFEYTFVAVSDVVDSDPESVAEYWQISEEQSLQTLRIAYTSAFTYGEQEILGISSAKFRGGRNITMELQAAGALICTYVSGYKDYSNIGSVLVFGEYGNGYFDFSDAFDGLELNAHPDVETQPTLLTVDVPGTTYEATYAYKFLMPQDAFVLYAGVSDLDSEVIGAVSEPSLSLLSGHEYLCLVTLQNAGKIDMSFVDVTWESLNTLQAKGRNILPAATKSLSTGGMSRSYKVKDLLR